MAHETEGFRLSLNGYLFPIVSGVEQVGLGPLAFDSLTVQSEADRKIIYDKRKNRRGQSLYSVVDPTAITGSLTLLSVPPKVIAMLMLGSVVARSDSGGTVSGETVTVASDYWTSLAYPNISAVTVTKDAATYVLGTDYELDTKLGLIRPIAGGSIVDGTVDVDYTYSGVTGDRITVGTNITTRARIVGEGVNDVSDDAVEFEGYQALLTPKGELDLVGDDPITAEFDVVWETPSGRTYPIRIDYPTYA